MNIFKQYFNVYKNTILVVLFLLCLTFTAYKSFNAGQNNIQKKWDKETIALQQQKIEQQNKILELQQKLAVQAQEQQQKDIELAQKYAEERAKLQAQAKQMQTKIDELLKNKPQYNTCVLDDETLKELNRSLR